MLKPCPHCNGEARVEYDEDGTDWYVLCGNCGAHSNWESRSNAAIQVWNQRVNVPWLPEDLVERAISISNEWGTAHQRVELLRDIIDTIKNNS